ncbi:hypothetical protein CBM2617_A70061 [Cupriavidus taiwanensis]|uniref:hypothetical protein n=1 Tax=Cupriavidus taiwanensis TaxID=164546 RepID=UPI000E12792B|nr:hypothetical protein [Cupriavidus taiwanensis]SOZ63497.1 hypothetical protein CBM2617_A70061 [Cupriavidus taiwanensis]SOZ82493.1 hypothetical protein CBM2618_A80061 [Cupriavidus taiwanensis]SOZ84382.1 hypothetical protein CBM2622_A80061 [Cupriavidus taiwanensis]SOZ92126.1 hypothetical protein CBM2621_A80061 [Cupriavidus taiwanensis]
MTATDKLLEDLQWCLEDGMGGPRTKETLAAAISRIRELESAAAGASQPGGVADETAMRVSLAIMANLEDRSGVLDGVDDEIKQEIADEIAVIIKTHTFPAPFSSTARGEAVSQPVYLVSYADEGGWYEAPQKVYDTHPKHARRIVYAAAPQRGRGE